jgi:GntR family transcriptional regulator, transcriptional repressor for pyruvate dehydrogenase complex
VTTNLLRFGDGSGSGSGEHIGTSVRAPKTAELISSHLRRQIVRGELKPHDALPSEAELMGQFGVSRPTLREAFRILETENLITVRRGARGGAQVTAPDLSVAARYVGVLLQIQGTTLEDVSIARMVTEPACAGLLARRRTEGDLADLRAVVAELVAATGPAGLPDSARWTRLSYRFHELVVERCGNKTLAIQVAVLQDIVATHIAATISRETTEPATASRFRRMMRSYAKLIELLEARDADGAERHWRAHLEAAAKSMSRMVPLDRQVVDLFS